MDLRFCLIDAVTLRRCIAFPFSKLSGGAGRFIVKVRHARRYAILFASFMRLREVRNNQTTIGMREMKER